MAGCLQRQVTAAPRHGCPIFPIQAFHQYHDYRGAVDSMPIRPSNPAKISGRRNKQKPLEILRTQSALFPYSADVKINKKSTWAFLKSFQHPKQSQKGNFLQRMHKPLSHNDTALEIPVQTSRDAYSKTVAHYAILDAEESIGIEDLHFIMKEANVARSVDNLHPFGWASNFTHVHRSVKQTPASAAFTSFLEMSPQTSETSLSDQEEKIKPSASELKQDVIEAQLLKTTTQPRPSRLAQMGRIETEVSKSDRDRTLPNQSFSRPFVVSQPSPSHRVLSLREAFSQSAPNPTHLTLADVQPTGPLDAVTEGHRLLRNEASFLKTSPEAADPVGDSEFICFPARKNSDMCYSSSSGTMSLPTKASTAVVPLPGSPPSEDEIWKEYDDLIDDVLTPCLLATSPSMGSLSVRSDYFTNRETKPANLGRYTDQGKTVSPRLHANEALSPAKYGSHLLGGCDQDSVTNTPMTSISGLAAAYGEHNLQSTSTSKSIRAVNKCTSPSTIQSSIRSRLRDSGSSKYSRSASDMESQSRDTRQSKSTELSRTAVLSNLDPQVMANLEFSSLMIGKWLSFGRVLFSPAHFELKNLREDRILVVDGLGKEWSHYVALTYPNATVYSLGPSPSHCSTRYTFGAFHFLPNHRHFAQVNMSSNFPFPKGFFAAMVIRFPAAASDVTLRSMISECKRVLRPGGYVEISTLDLDLTNMGNHARRALRELKIRMQVADPNISLKPVSDNIQHLLGRRGFENLNRCIVGIPAAGGSSDSYEQPKDEKNVSFTELLTDYSIAGDERITKMVARVGRWWYMRCYETGVLPDGDFTRTIWNDNNLLSECEKMQTTFKFLVCYAQKPTVTQRRTVSL